MVPSQPAHMEGVVTTRRGISRVAGPLERPDGSHPATLRSSCKSSILRAWHPRGRPTLWRQSVSPSASERHRCRARPDGHSVLGRKKRISPGIASESRKEQFALATFVTPVFGQEDRTFPKTFPTTGRLSPQLGAIGSHLCLENELLRLDEVDGSGHRSRNSNVSVVVGRREDHPLTEGEQPA